jgi:hypothetical protein
MRDPQERRNFSTDPIQYFKRVLGYEPAKAERVVIEALGRSNRLVLEAEESQQAKTFRLLGALALFYFDALAAQPVEHKGEQGGQIILVGPVYETIRETVFQEIIELSDQAEMLGNSMLEGRVSQYTKQWYGRPWQVGPKWKMIAVTARGFTYPGYHHRNQLAIAVEGNRLKEKIWMGLEDLCSAEKNKIIVVCPLGSRVAPVKKRRVRESWTFVRFQ